MKDEAFAAALAWLSASGESSAHQPSNPASPTVMPVWRHENAYGDMSYPPVEHRLLGLFRLWTAIEFFYPYHSLLDRPWSEVPAARSPQQQFRVWN